MSKTPRTDAVINKWIVIFRGLKENSYDVQEAIQAIGDAMDEMEIVSKQLETELTTLRAQLKEAEYALKCVEPFLQDAMKYCNEHNLIERHTGVLMAQDKLLIALKKRGSESQKIPGEI